MDFYVFSSLKIGFYLYWPDRCIMTSQPPPTPISGRDEQQQLSCPPAFVALRREHEVTKQKYNNHGGGTAGEGC
jgi:hypothetical protein